MHEIDDWMKINGEAVYDTRMNDVTEEGAGIRFTKSKDVNTKFINLFNYPKDKIILNKFSFDKKATVTVLGNSKKLNWKQKDGGVEIQIPAKMKSASEYVWVLKVQM